jgi:para-aminobenzoate synthetase
MSSVRPRVLLVDNYDSYTYNLYHLIAQVSGCAADVVQNDRLADVASIHEHYTHVVISPGPGHPADPRRAGRTVELVATARIPVLGVCLGHQIIALAFGAEVRRVTPHHGLVSAIYHDQRGVFREMPQRFSAVRYHSLAVDNVPGELQVTARADDLVVMGIRHRSRPLHGVQFHPESVCSQHGSRLMGNFLQFEGDHERPMSTARSTCQQRARLLVREIPWQDPEAVFAFHYANRPLVCWLDSAARDQGLARFSYIGAPEGPRAHTVTYHVSDGTTRIHRDFRHHTDINPVDAPDVTFEEGDIYAFLSRELARYSVSAAGVPFEFCGGYVGYLGYELKQLQGVANRHQATTPDAAFVYLERFLAFDHDQHQAFLVAHVAPGEDTDAIAWLDHAERAVADTPMPPPPARDGWLCGVQEPDEQWYRAAFEKVRCELESGDSYEVNLTLRRSFRCSASHAELYRHVRHSNPTPYAAFLRLPEVTVLSSSPERFIRVGTDGSVEAKPIKGTAPRHDDRDLDDLAAASLAREQKTVSENLMVVDLIRSDLGQVCQPGSVSVPAFLDVESFTTVHQLVTTVRGVLEPTVDAPGCVKSIFPPGSMTGAPKMRTMEIIDDVEIDARGVYSGALGYFSHSGSADLSVVIRTIVAVGNRMSIGFGGGLVALSDAADEYHEALLKGSTMMTAVENACQDSMLTANAIHSLHNRTSES